MPFFRAVCPSGISTTLFLLILKSPGGPGQFGPGHQIIALRLGQVAFGLQQVQFCIFHLKPDFDPQRKPGLGHTEQPFGLGYGAGQRLENLFCLPYRIYRLAGFQGNGVKQFALISLEAADIAFGLGYLAVRAAAIEQGPGKEQPGIPDCTICLTKILPSGAGLEIQAGLQAGLGNSGDLFTHADPMPKIGKLGPLVYGQGQGRIKGGRRGDQRLQLAGGIDLFIK